MDHAPTRSVEIHDVLVPMWRGMVVYRVVALLSAVVNLVRFGPDYARPGLGIAVVVAMAAWTAFTSVHYLRDGNRRVAVADLVVTSAATLSTLVVEDPARIALGAPVITTVWSAAAVLAMAVALGWRGGLVAGVVTVGVLIGVRQAADTDFFYDSQLLVVVGLAVGLAADTMRRSALRLQAAVATEAATAERERLARDIHDGVLQVLSFVRRRGEEVARTEPDGSVAELAHLAGEQEVALRRLITSTAPPRTPDGEVDLSAVLGTVLPTHASLAVPAEPVRLPAMVADGLVAVVREAAANSAEHAGRGTGLWVLVESGDDAVTVSVRDDGPGIPAGRLAEAEADGHLGVASSIRGRVRELGGVVDLHTGADQGTEWEIRIPRSGRSDASPRSGRSDASPRSGRSDASPRSDSTGGDP